MDTQNSPAVQKRELLGGTLRSSLRVRRLREEGGTSELIVGRSPSSGLVDVEGPDLLATKDEFAAAIGHDAAAVDQLIEHDLLKVDGCRCASLFPAGAAADFNSRYSRDEIFREAVDWMIGAPHRCNTKSEPASIAIMPKNSTRSYVD